MIAPRKPPAVAPEQALIEAGEFVAALLRTGDHEITDAVEDVRFGREPIEATVTVE